MLVVRQYAEERVLSGTFASCATVVLFCDCGVRFMFFMSYSPFIISSISCHACAYSHSFLGLCPIEVLMSWRL